MSVEAMVWVLRHSDAKLSARLTLIALADFAHPDGSEAYPSVDTIARHANISRRSAQVSLRTLEDDGMIVRDGCGRNGTACWRIVMGGADSAPRADNDARGRKIRPGGGAKSAPNPSKGTVQRHTEGNAQARANEKAQTLPDGFPEDLKPHARDVYRVLRSTAEQFNAKEVTPRAVGHAILSAPGRRYVEEAHKMAAWCQGTSKPVKDVVSRYQRWLGNADVYAGTERIGAPIAAGDGGGNVHRFQSKFERAQAGLQVAYEDAVRREQEATAT